MVAKFGALSTLLLVLVAFLSCSETDAGKPILVAVWDFREAVCECKDMACVASESAKLSPHLKEIEGRFLVAMEENPLGLFGLSTKHDPVVSEMRVATACVLLLEMTMDKSLEVAPLRTPSADELFPITPAENAVSRDAENQRP